jgi:hypothetical protein
MEGKEAYKAPVRKPANFMCSNRSYSGMKTVRGIETGADENRTSIGNGYAFFHPFQQDPAISR